MANAADVYGLAELRRWDEVTDGVNPPLRLAVCGDPVAHSASPPMHNAALEHCGIAARYTRLHLRPDELAEAFSLLGRNRFIGVNCTIPHKPAALNLVDEVDASARRAGGVNTVRSARRMGTSRASVRMERECRAQCAKRLAHRWGKCAWRCSERAGEQGAPSPCSARAKVRNASR